MSRKSKSFQEILVVRHTGRSFVDIQLTMFDKYRKTKSDLDFFVPDRQNAKEKNLFVWRCNEKLEALRWKPKPTNFGDEIIAWKLQPRNKQGIKKRRLKKTEWLYRANRSVNTMQQQCLSLVQFYLENYLLLLFPQINHHAYGLFKSYFNLTIGNYQRLKRFAKNLECNNIYSNRKITK